MGIHGILWDIVPPDILTGWNTEFFDVPYRGSYTYCLCILWKEPIRMVPFDEYLVSGFKAIIHSIMYTIHSGIYITPRE